MKTIGERALDVAMQELDAGIKEEPPGSNTSPRIKEYLYPCVRGDRNIRLGLTASNWCFTGDTEILAEEGWLRLDSLGKGKVAQVHPETLEVTLVDPHTTIHKMHDGPLIVVNRRSMRLVSDPEHRYFGRWQIAKRKGKRSGVPDLELRPISDLLTTSSQLKIPTPVGAPDHGGVDWSDRDLQLLGCFLADGCVAHGKIKFEVNKPHKIALLTALGPERIWRAHKAYGPRSVKPLTHFFYELLKRFDECTSSYKVLDQKFLWSLNRRQAALLLDTFASFDGHQRKGSIVLAQSSKERINMAQTLAVLAGYSCQTRPPSVHGEFGSTMHSLCYIRGGRGTYIRSKDLRQTKPTKVDLYCVQVPQGLIIVRPSGYGRASVVGNCAALVCWCTKQATRTTDDPPHGYRAGVVELVADVKDTDAKWSGRWHNVKEVREGKWTPKPGDLAIYDRSNPTKPETSWWRHVNRVVSYSIAEQSFTTVGGNEQQKITLAVQSIHQTRLLGFIAYPQPKEVRPKQLLSAKEKSELASLVYITIDGVLRDSIYEDSDS
jgi:hypothetical protein